MVIKSIATDSYLTCWDLSLIITYFLSAGDLGAGDRGIGDLDRPPEFVGEGVLSECCTAQRDDALAGAGVWFLTSLLDLTNTPLRGSH